MLSDAFNYYCIGIEDWSIILLNEKLCSLVQSIIKYAKDNTDNVFSLSSLPLSLIVSATTTATSTLLKTLYPNPILIMSLLMVLNLLNLFRIDPWLNKQGRMMISLTGIYCFAIDSVWATTPKKFLIILWKTRGECEALNCYHSYIVHGMQHWNIWEEDI